MAAFRGNDGTVVAFFGDADRAGGAHGNLTGGFYRSYGPSVLNLRRDCSAPILKSGAVSNGPGVFPHNVWLMATWTDDGTTVHGLVHDEYTPNATDTTLCPGGFNKTTHSTCWYTTVLAVVSTDGGRHFEFSTTIANPRGIALAPPVGFNPDFTRPQGFPNSTWSRALTATSTRCYPAGKVLTSRARRFRPAASVCTAPRTSATSAAGVAGTAKAGLPASLIRTHPQRPQLPAISQRSLARGW